ncbi:hypothetical protein ACFV6Z_09230 [Streptomyces sp. NPDC059818]|uniref:hypothetical protein n=1 Tax=Streptomyces sp. NPDC059818 TaxID=3346962 RepID=UPI00364CA350
MKPAPLDAPGVTLVPCLPSDDETAGKLPALCAYADRGGLPGQRFRRLSDGRRNPRERAPDGPGR